MSRPAAPIVCDGPGCQKHKQEANHWWTIQACSADGEIVVHPGTVDVSRMNPPSAWTAFDACGHECALKILSEQMGKVSQ